MKIVNSLLSRLSSNIHIRKFYLESVLWHFSVNNYTPYKIGIRDY